MNTTLDLILSRWAQNNYEILQKVNKNICKSELKEYEQVIPSSAVRPPLKEIPFDPNNNKFILFDIETSSTWRKTELLQLSANADDGFHSFSGYILPERLITTTATTVHNITVKVPGDRRILCKAGNPVPAKPLQTSLKDGAY